MLSRKIASDYLNKSIPGSFSGLPAFAEGYNYKDKQKVRDILWGVEAYSLHKRQRKPKTRRTLIFYPHQTYVIDPLQLSQEDAKRERFSFVLVCLDGFSRYLWAEVCKEKAGKTVLDALKKIFKESGVSFIFFSFSVHESSRDSLYLAYSRLYSLRFWERG